MATRFDSSQPYEDALLEPLLIPRAPLSINYHLPIQRGINVLWRRPL